VDAAGNVYPQSSNLYLNQGFTHIVDIGSGYLILYNKLTGEGRVDRLTEDGSYRQYNSRALSAGWTHILPIGGAMATFYDSATGRLVTVQVAVDGSFETRGMATIGAGWQKVLTLSSNVFFAYVDRRPIRNVGVGITGRINGSGQYSGLQSYETFSPDWTHITPDGDDLLHFYNANTGDVAFGKVYGSTGTFEQLATYSFRAGWTHFAAGEHSILISYDSATGAAVTGQLKDWGEYTDLKVYEGDNAFLQGWDIITPMGIR
jgi:hypothetical protein